MNVLVVDMLEGFTRTGALASPRIEALIPKQVEFLKSLPKNAFIVFACDAHKKGDSEFKRMPVHCLKGSEEAKICPELLEAIGNRAHVRVPKQTHSAFFNTDMDKIIANRGNDWIVIGCVTDICITANVMELDYRGKNITIYRDLVDTYKITAEQSNQLCGDYTKMHLPDPFNYLFLNHYLPGVWGVKIKCWGEC